MAGTIAGIHLEEAVMCHTDTATIQAGSAPVTVEVEGFGQEVIQSHNGGRPISNFDEVDAIRVDEGHDDAVHTIQQPTTGAVGTYRDTLTLTQPERSDPFKASGGNGRIDGGFSSDDASHAFAAALGGDTPAVESGGAKATHTRRRPRDGPGPPTRTRWCKRSILRRQGSCADLRDARRTHTGQRLRIREGGRSVPAASGSGDRVHPGRTRRSVAGRRPGLHLFVLSFGPETVGQARGSGGKAPWTGGGSSVTVDDCMTSYGDPATFAGAMHARGCWSATGRLAYDPVESTFSYQEFGGHDSW